MAYNREEFARTVRAKLLTGISNQGTAWTGLTETQIWSIIYGNFATAFVNELHELPEWRGSLNFQVSRRCAEADEVIKMIAADLYAEGQKAVA